MKQHIEDRVLSVASYILATHSTIREVADYFKVSKSTIELDASVRLFRLNKQLYTEVRQVIEYNKEQRSLRGGESTRRKYKNEICN